MRGYTPPILPEEESIIWGDEEGYPLTALQQSLFLLLRRSMDRSTGIAGSKSAISYAGLYERLYQPARAGYAGTGDAWGKDRLERSEYIRSQVRYLEKAGLIKLVSKGKKLQVEFVIFNQFKSLYFSVQNKLSGILPDDISGILPDENINKNNKLSVEDTQELTMSKVGELSTSPEVSRYKDTTTTVATLEIWKSDPLAAVMLAGGVSEYHVATGLHVINAWRSLAGYSEASAIALVKARLSRNPQINSVSYFTGAIQQMCACALQESNHGKSYPRNRFAGRAESDGDRLEREAIRLGILH